MKIPKEKMFLAICLILLVSSQVNATGGGKKLSLTAKKLSLPVKSGHELPLTPQNGSKILQFLAAHEARNAKLILNRINLVLKRLKSIEKTFEKESIFKLRLVRL